MKRIFSMLLAVIMLCGILAGCSSEQDAFIGTWNASVNMAEAVNEQMGDLGEMADYISLDDFTVTMTLVFNEDGTYAMSLDRDSVEAAFNGFMEDLKAAAYTIVEEQIAALGVDMSVEDMLAASGMDIDSLMEQSMAGVDMDGIIDSVIEEAALKGNFKVKDGKLYLSAGLEYAVDNSSYENYELEGNTLTLVSSSGILADEFAAMYPVVFEKAA